MKADGALHGWMPAWLAGYRREWLRPDVVAGLGAAAVVIPKSLAYATIAGLPVQVGLYTACVPMAIYALLGTSRLLSVSTTTTLAILAGAALAQVAAADPSANLLVASATLALLVGLVLGTACALRLGFVADFISEPVLVGFKAGIGIVIVVDQIPKLLGIHFAKGSFPHNVWAIVQGAPHASMPTLAIALVTLALLAFMVWRLPRAPAPLIAVALGVAAVALLDLPARGVEIVGRVPTGLPAVMLPDLSMVATLWPSALGIALMSFTETIAAGRAFAHEREPPPQPNRELLATGLANAGGALLGAMVAGGGTSQTAVNQRAGARSQLAALVTAGAALGTMLLLAPVIGLMPNATLAAVVMVYSIGLIDPAEFRAIRKIRRMEFVWALVAMAGVVGLGTLQGILVAIIVSLLALAYQAADPPLYVLARKRGTNVFRPLSPEHAGDEVFAGLLILRPEGRVFFANARRLGQRMRQHVTEDMPRVVLLDLSGVIDLEYTALKMLIEAERALGEQGVSLWLAGLNPEVLAMVRRATLADALGAHRMFATLEQALVRFQSPETSSPAASSS